MNFELLKAFGNLAYSLVCLGLVVMFGWQAISNELHGHTELSLLYLCACLLVGIHRGQND
jgi:hypothetical protein